MMERGTNAKRMLLGQDFPLRLGYVGLKGRSQQDLQNGVKIAEGLKAEKEYFESHPVYPHLPSGSVGTEALIQKLAEVLLLYLRRTILEVCQEIQAKTTQCEEELKDLALSKDENEQIITEKERLCKTLEVLKSVLSTLNNDPEYFFSSLCSLLIFFCLAWHQIPMTIISLESLEKHRKVKRMSLKSRSQKEKVSLMTYSNLQDRRVTLLPQKVLKEKIHLRNR